MEKDTDIHKITQNVRRFTHMRIQHDIALERHIVFSSAVNQFHIITSRGFLLCSSPHGVFAFSFETADMFEWFECDPQAMPYACYRHMLAPANTHGLPAGLLWTHTAILFAIHKYKEFNMFLESSGLGKEQAHIADHYDQMAKLRNIIFDTGLDVGVHSNTEMTGAEYLTRLAQVEEKCGSASCG